MGQRDRSSGAPDFAIGVVAKPMSGESVLDRINEWGRIEHATTADEWGRLRELLLREFVATGAAAGEAKVDPDAKRPLERILRIVEGLGCRTVLIERRYVDPDYRSDYSRFWSHTFEGRDPFATRLHFFTRHIDEAELHALPAESELGYLGYSVMRPTPRGPVGRTLIPPPKELVRSGVVLTLVEDTVHVFGQRLTVRGAPFCQQDGQFFRCAHAAAWMCHYNAALRGLAAREVTATFADAAPVALSSDRLLPSHGMNSFQLQATFAALGLPAIAYELEKLPSVGGVTDPKHQLGRPAGEWDTRLFSIACRYLNSGFPVLVGTESDHAFTLVGWYQDGDEMIRFVANDDVDGPYMQIDSPFTDKEARHPWETFMIPLPPSVLVSGEEAEDSAFSTLTLSASRAEGGVTELAKLGDGDGDGDGEAKVKLRTGLRDGSAYKAMAAERGLPEDVVRMIRLAQLPHYVWVTEAHLVEACSDGGPCVVAEIVHDSTSDGNGPRADLLLLPGAGVTFPPADGAAQQSSSSVPARWVSSLSVCDGAPPAV